MQMDTLRPTSTPKGVDKKVCAFCGEGKADEGTHGKLLSKAGITAHYFCMLFSSGLSQNGESEKQGILGFLPSDITKEVRRGARLRCSYCKKHGATIGCVTKNCKKNFHLGCGQKNEAFHIFYDTFSSHCASHRPQQDVPAEEDPSIVCPICTNHVKAAPCNESLRAPCCRKYWYHRDCLQQYSLSAGLYFFKCPMCNNKEMFQKEMLCCGIYIPDQDASWETEPNAYQELLERYQNCDAQVCKCVEGRKYDKEGSKWEILLCNVCGSQGSHEACEYLVKHAGQHMCPDCAIINKKGNKEKKMKSPKRSSFEQLQLKMATSPVSTKQASSEYPGPSQSVLKRKIPEKYSSNKKPRLSLKSHDSTTGYKDTKSNTKKVLLSPSTDLAKKKEKRKDFLKVEEQRKCSKGGKVKSTFMDRYFNMVGSPSSASSSGENSSDDPILLSYLSKNQLMSAYDLKKEKKHKKKKEKVQRDKQSTPGRSPDKREMFSPSPKNGFSQTPNHLKKYTQEKKDPKKVDHFVMEKNNTLVKGSLKPQKTLDFWLTGKNTSTSKEQKPPQNEKQVFNTSSIGSNKPDKKPTVIEWRGKQLVIRSPRVLLRKRAKLEKTRPKMLEIDMVDERGNKGWDMELTFLSNIDAGIRVTRNMINSNDMASLSIKTTLDQSSKRTSKRKKTSGIKLEEKPDKVNKEPEISKSIISRGPEGLHDEQVKKECIEDGLKNKISIYEEFFSDAGQEGADTTTVIKSNEFSFTSSVKNPQNCLLAESLKNPSTFVKVKEEIPKMSVGVQMLEPSAAQTDGSSIKCSITEQYYAECISPVKKQGSSSSKHCDQNTLKDSPAKNLRSGRNSKLSLETNGAFQTASSGKQNEENLSKITTLNSKKKQTSRTNKEGLRNMRNDMNIVSSTEDALLVRGFCPSLGEEQMSNRENHAECSRYLIKENSVTNVNEMKPYSLDKSAVINSGFNTVDKAENVGSPGNNKNLLKESSHSKQVTSSSTNIQILKNYKLNKISLSALGKSSFQSESHEAVSVATGKPTGISSADEGAFSCQVVEKSAVMDSPSRNTRSSSLQINNNPEVRKTLPLQNANIPSQIEGSLNTTIVESSSVINSPSRNTRNSSLQRGSTVDFRKKLPLQGVNFPSQIKDSPNTTSLDTSQVLDSASRLTRSSSLQTDNNLEVNTTQPPRNKNSSLQIEDTLNTETLERSPGLDSPSRHTRSASLQKNDYQAVRKELPLPNMDNLTEKVDTACTRTLDSSQMLDLPHRHTRAATLQKHNHAVPNSQHEDKQSCRSSGRFHIADNYRDASRDTDGNKDCRKSLPLQSICNHSPGDGSKFIKSSVTQTAVNSIQRPLSHLGKNDTTGTNSSNIETMENRCPNVLNMTKLKNYVNKNIRTDNICTDNLSDKHKYLGNCIKDNNNCLLQLQCDDTENLSKHTWIQSSCCKVSLASGEKPVCPSSPSIAQRKSLVCTAGFHTDSSKISRRKRGQHRSKIRLCFLPYPIAESPFIILIRTSIDPLDLRQSKICCLGDGLKYAVWETV